MASLAAGYRSSFAHYWVIPGTHSPCISSQGRAVGALTELLKLTGVAGDMQILVLGN